MADLLGFVGVGRMGGPMSSRLLDAGYSLCVFDTNPDAVKPLAARGAQVAGSPTEVASAATIVLMSLPTPAIVQSVALGESGFIRGSRVRTVKSPRFDGEKWEKSTRELGLLYLRTSRRLAFGGW